MPMTGCFCLFAARAVTVLPCCFPLLRHTPTGNRKSWAFFCGGPDAYVFPDGGVLLGGREIHIPSRPKTMIYAGTADGNFQEMLMLPSFDDNSYPSFLKVGGKCGLPITRVMKP